MQLTMTVLRCPDAVAPETRSVQGGEFTAGRGPGVDWVLPDPEQVVSKHHFMVAFRAGSWQIHDLSTNGTVMNRDAAPIGRDRPRPLRDGDRLKLGPYEIEVRLTDAPVQSQYGGGGFAGLGEATPFGGPRGGFDPSAPTAPDNPFFEPEGPQGSGQGFQLPEFDPLAPVGNDPGYVAPFRGPAQSDHSSVLQDAYRPPADTGQLYSQTGGIIKAGELLPADLDDLLAGIAPGAPGGTTPPAAAPYAAPPPAIAPVTPPPASPAIPVARSPVAPPVTPAAPPPPAAPVGPDGAQPFAEPFDDLAPVSKPAVAHLGVATYPAASSTASPPSLAPSHSTAPATSVAGAGALGTGDAALLAAFMQGVGLADARPADPVLMMRRLGEAFRSFVSGLRAVLIARDEVRSEFRIEQTIYRSKARNPLQLSADDDDAVTALLGVGRRTAMTPADAVADALHKIELHELASMTAMQSAVRVLLSGLAPEKLRAAAEQGGGVAVLPGQRRARAWDHYEATYARTLRALSDDFDSVFGKAFARAYEEALDQLSQKGKQ